MFSGRGAWYVATPPLSYVQLRDVLRTVASAVPARAEDGSPAGIALLDQCDVWLDALADGPLLLDGTESIRGRFSMLYAGLRA